MNGDSYTRKRHAKHESGTHVWRDVFLYARYLMNLWMDWNQICMGITLGHDEGLIRFW